MDMHHRVAAITHKPLDIAEDIELLECLASPPTDIMHSAAKTCELVFIFLSLKRLYGGNVHNRPSGLIANHVPHEREDPAVAYVIYVYLKYFHSISDVLYCALMCCVRPAAKTLPPVEKLIPLSNL